MERHQTQIVYAFLQQRPCDAQPWPVLYLDAQLAHDAYCRISDVVAVALTPYERPVNEEQK